MISSLKHAQTCMPPTQYSAALPWYDHPSTRPTLQRVWREAQTLLRNRGVAGLPVELDTTTPYQALWQQPQLALSQCCGLDLFQPDTAAITPFAAPVITALDVSPGEYFSHIVTRSGSNLEVPRVAVNNLFSHSGHTAILLWLKKQDIERFTIIETGSHAMSVLALRNKQADVAAIDALSWPQLDTAGIVIVDASDPAPAPPFVTGNAANIPLEQLIGALDAAFKRHGQPVGIGGAIPVTRSHYHAVSDAATAAGLLPA